jgi:hypothetical protein
MPEVENSTPQAPSQEDRIRDLELSSKTQGVNLGRLNTRLKKVRSAQRRTNYLFAACIGMLVGAEIGVYSELRSPNTTILAIIGAAMAPLLVMWVTPEEY